MDQRIFEQGFSVEATSLYLLLVALADSGTALNRESVLPFWNATPEELDRAARELDGRRVVESDAAGGWHVLPAAEWLPA